MLQHTHKHTRTHKKILFIDNGGKNSNKINRNLSWSRAHTKKNWFQWTLCWFGCCFCCGLCWIWICLVHEIIHFGVFTYTFGHLKPVINPCIKHTNTLFFQFIYLRWFSHRRRLKILIDCIYKTNYLLNVNSLPSVRRIYYFLPKTLTIAWCFVCVFFLHPKKSREDIASVLCEFVYFFVCAKYYRLLSCSIWYPNIHNFYTIRKHWMTPAIHAYTNTHIHTSSLG